MVETTGLGAVNVLDAMCIADMGARLVHASSSSVLDPGRYGLYGAAKVLAHDAVIGMRHLVHASNAIFYSHTSPRQDPRFLVPRICSTLARIAAGSGERLQLGDIDARRAWGYAPDYVRALRLIAEQDTPGDWLVRPERSHSVGDVVRAALAALGLEWGDAVTVDPDAPRVADEVIDQAHRNATELGWVHVTTLPGIVASLMGVS
jgi:GDPmannose 4,6-dehydratase